MQAPTRYRLHLDRFPVGIDNIRTDVALAPELVGAATDLLRITLQEEAARNFWKDSVQAPNIDAQLVFERQYQAAVTAAVNQARAQGRVERFQLFHLGLLKFLLDQVDIELDALRSEMQERHSEQSSSRSGAALELHERLVILAKAQQPLRHRALLRVTRSIARVERGQVRKLRKSVLGKSWPVPEVLLFNPLLQLGGWSSEDDFAGRYCLALRGPGLASGLRALYGVLGKYLPETVRLGTGRVPDASVLEGAGAEVGHVRGKRLVETLLAAAMAPEEFEKTQLSWLDEPENVRQLFGGVEGDWPDAGPWQHTRWPGVQRRLVEDFGAALEHANLRDAVVAGYAMNSLGLSMPSVAVFNLCAAYLGNELSRREFQRRLSAADVQQPDDLVRPLEQVRRSLAQRPPPQKLQELARFAGDLARFRRDLKLAHEIYQGMARIHLLLDEKDAALSRANGLLQEFPLSGPTESRGEISGHVILKADVRGSTRITARMREQGLNPAAFFSRHLYEPINQLLEGFGAVKLFVEGDAVILALMEYREQHMESLAVARACGLARKILEVVNAKNREGARSGLPKLELGLGIAYAAEPPTYLYDEGHRITISPAINRADRLSSCNRALRELEPAKYRNGQGVEVVVPAFGDSRVNEEVLRYNVNGVELEDAAYHQLQQEVVMRRVRMRDPVSGENQQYFAGRYPDAKGHIHWLAVREAPVRLWVGRELVPDSSGRTFFEVVTDHRLVEHIRKGIAASQGGEDAFSEMGGK